MRERVVEQRVTFRETLQTLHIIWDDKTSFEIYGKKGKTTKKQVYKEIFGKKARKQYYKQYRYLTEREINEIIKTHAEYLKTATVVIHVAALLDGDLRRANLKARILTNSVTAQNLPQRRVG